MFKTKLIEKARILKGLTQKELAAQVGIHLETYRRIIKGESQNPKTVKTLADFLSLSMEELYIDEEERNPHMNGTEAA